MPTFDGDNLLIILDSGVSSVDAVVDLYSDWKEWFKTPPNAKYPVAFRAIGGDPLTATLDAGTYVFLQNQNGWRIRPPEEDIDITITGNLVREDLNLGITVPTVGGYTVTISGLQPVTQTSHATDVWSALRSDYQGSGTYGELFATAVSATVSDEAPEADRFITNLTETTNNHYKGRLLTFLDGNLKNQTTDVVQYFGATKQIVVTGMTEAPANGDTFVIT